MQNTTFLKRRKGQSIIEFTICLPFLIFLFIWLIKIFNVLTASSLQQIYARHRLWFVVDNRRDLRNSQTDNDTFFQQTSNDYAKSSFFRNKKASLNARVLTDISGAKYPTINMPDGVPKMELKTNISILRSYNKRP